MALTNAGLTEVVKGIGGETPTFFNNANSAIAIGTGSTAYSASDTTLGTETGRKAMEATFPSRSGLVVTYKSIFGTGDGNNGSAVQEWGILNNTTSGGTLLSRKVENLGVKSSAQSWTVTATLTWSVGT
jgi:hypothetical protein